jgi:outer membrane protein TolC
VLNFSNIKIFGELGLEKALLVLLISLSFSSWSQENMLSNFDQKEESDETQQGWKKRNLVDTGELEKGGRTIDLKSVLEEGFRKNPLEKIRQQQRDQIELSKTDLWQKFWLPTISLELETSEHRIDRIHESTRSNGSMGAQQAPTGSLGLVIDEYTLFNWGRDYYSYQNSKETLNRKTQQLTEARRRLKFNLINQYFNLIRSKEIKRVYQEQLRQMSFVHRLAQEKLKLRKIRTQEYYQTRSEFLRSQTEYQQSLFEVGIQEEELANLLGDDWRGSYSTNENLKYISVNTSVDEALKSTLEQSVDYRNVKLQFDNANRTYEKTLKDNLPLPKFSFNLGTYQTGFDPNGTSWQYETSTNNRNIELVAAIDMRWTLLGEGGLFNSRVNQQEFLNKRIAEINYYNIKRQLEVKVRTIYKTLRFIEKKVEISLSQEKNAQTGYDSVLDNYLAGNATYADIKIAIDNLVSSQINSENVKYDHLLKKLELADYMGLEDLPGENFEQLAQR